jgi:CBS domain containing-hemolysin-like protein
MAIQIVIISVLLGFSAFFSGAETALFALTRHQISRFRRSPRASHRLVAELMQRPRRLLLTLMIGNVTINMFIFAASLALFRSLAGEESVWGPILGLASPILVTLFGEILPKGTAIEMRERFSVRLAPAVRFFQLFLTLPRVVLNTLLVEPLTRLLVHRQQADNYVTADELRELIEMSGRHQIIDADENAMLDEVIQLSDLRVRDVMVPRVDVIAWDIHSHPDELRRLLREKRFTKLPVCDEDLDHIVGLVYARDLYLNPDRAPESLLRPIRFVPEMITLTQLLAEFRRAGMPIAAVVDEYGGVVGLVTVEDVAEQIVGDLTLAGEPEEHPMWERIDERRYRVSGRMSVREWSEQFQVSTLAEGITSLGGLMLAHLGRLPEVGDRVRVGNVRLTIESLRGRRIEWILLELEPEADSAALGVNDDRPEASRAGRNDDQTNGASRGGEGDA